MEPWPLDGSIALAWLRKLRLDERWLQILAAAGRQAGPPYEMLSSAGQGNGRDGLTTTTWRCG
jgi:hypothetical protein